MYHTEINMSLQDFFNLHQDEAFSANTLIKSFEGKMDRATVYRQLKKLEEKGLIRKSLDMISNSFEYQYANDCEHHFHLKCIKCGKIIHLKCNEANLFVNHIKTDHDFYIDQKETVIMGICKKCYEEGYKNEKNI